MFNYGYLPHRYELQLWYGIFMMGVVKPIAMAYEAITAAMGREDRRDLREMLGQFLHDKPSPEDISERWLKCKGSLLETLRFGSRLTALEAYVDSSPIYRFCSKRGREIIVARNPGLRGWLREECPEIVYKTAMGYKIMAHRLRRAIGLPDFVPLEWAFPDQRHLDEARDKFYDLKEIRKARVKLLELLQKHRNAERLLRALDLILGLQRRKLSKPRRKMKRHFRDIIEKRSSDRMMRYSRDKYSPENMERIARGFQRMAEEKRQAARKA
jgi:hypothetical protein